MKRIILASASPRRAELLKNIGLPFEVMESGVTEECAVSQNPESLARTLAVQKATAVAKKVTRGIVIGADTLVCVDGTILGKPRSRAEAGEMLSRLSGRSHTVMTGLALAEVPGKRLLTHVETTRVFMRKLSGSEMEWYLDSNEPYDKAGGYGIQGKAGVFVERLEGCYFNVVGLPLAALWRMLRELSDCFWEGAGSIDIHTPDHQGPASG